MKRAPTMAGRFAAAGLSAALASLAPIAPAQAGDIVKCIDGGGHATFTDQPCPSGAASVKLSVDGSGARGGGGLTASTGASESMPPMPPALAPQRHVLPEADLRHDAWRRPAGARPAPLARDVATLKAARRTQLQQEGTRARLAGIE
jgi:hypothetical protein